MLASPAFKIYAAVVALLLLKTLLLSFATVLVRTKAKAWVNPEDARFFKGENVEKDAFNVERIRRAHANALENLVPFALLAALYMVTEPPLSYLQSYLYTFAIARILHTVFYLAGLQPWRSGMFVIGWLAQLGLAVQILLWAFAG